MRSYLPVLSLLLLWTGAVQAQGVLVPSDNSLTPLARVGHQVTVTITDQVAETQVAQVFRNPTEPATGSDLRVPRAQGGKCEEVRHVGRRQGGCRASWWRPTRHAPFTPTSSAGLRIPACWNMSAATCSVCGSSPSRPTATRNSPLALPRLRRRKTAGRVCLSAQDQQQERHHSGEVHPEGHPEVAAFAAEHLQSQPLGQGRTQGRPRGDRPLRGSQATSTRISNSTARRAARTSS